MHIVEHIKLECRSKGGKRGNNHMAKIVKITTNFDAPYVMRQTPGWNGEWGDYKFILNQPVEECDYWVVFEGLREIEHTVCPATNTLFITGEPESVRPYSEVFLKQFNRVLTSQRNILHSNPIFSQQGFLWWVGTNYIPESNSYSPEYKHNYDELILDYTVKKTKLLSVISSNKIFTNGHSQRLNFVTKLTSHFGEQIDFYGRYINSFSDKWDAIAPYKYHIAIENSCYEDYWTEKIADCFLSLTYPIYCGCPNLDNYFKQESFTAINIENHKEAIGIIEDVINADYHTKNYDFLVEAKKMVLNKYNFFPMLVDMFNKDQVYSKKEKITLIPE